MSTSSFFIKVECEAHSNRRSPRGMYQVEIVEPGSLLSKASAAIVIAMDHIPFFNENRHRSIITVFDNDGSEITIPSLSYSDTVLAGLFKGRVADIG